MEKLVDLCLQVDLPHPSEEEPPFKILSAFTWKRKPESGLDYLVCAMFAAGHDQRHVDSHLVAVSEDGEACRFLPPCRQCAFVCVCEREREKERERARDRERAREGETGWARERESERERERGASRRSFSG